jgi:hypothetical protein
MRPGLNLSRAHVREKGHIYLMILYSNYCAKWAGKSIFRRINFGSTLAFFCIEGMWISDFAGAMRGKQRKRGFTWKSTMLSRTVDDFSCARVHPGGEYFLTGCVEPKSVQLNF